MADHMHEYLPNWKGQGFRCFARPIALFLCRPQGFLGGHHAQPRVIGPLHRRVACLHGMREHQERQAVLAAARADATFGVFLA